VGGLCFLSLRLKAVYRILPAAGFAAFVCSVYGVELFLRVSNPGFARPLQPFMDFHGKDREKVTAGLARQFGITIDTRERGEVLSELWSRGIDAVPQIVLPPLENDSNDRELQSRVMPLGGKANTTTVACNQNGQYLTYRSDQYGFHNPPEVWRSDSIEIAALGNSFTVGYCVPSDKNFVAEIRRRYPATINLGMTGEGPLHVLGVLNEYAAELKPAKVLWFYAEGSSPVELATGKRSRTLLSYLRPEFTQGLRKRQSEVDQAVRFYLERQGAEEERIRTMQLNQRPARSSDLLDFAKLTALRRGLGMLNTAAVSEKVEKLPEPSVYQGDLNLLRDIFSAAKSRVSAWGGQLYFIYIPAPGRFFENPGPGAALRTEILTIARGLEIPVIDTYPVFKSHSDPLSLFPFRRPGHINEEGHRLVANAVLDGFVD
jgi:hypothetical protein